MHPAAFASPTLSPALAPSPPAQPILQYIRNTQAESRKAAEVLSFLPGVDVAALMDQASGRSGPSGIGMAVGRMRSHSSAESG